MTTCQFCGHELHPLLAPADSRFRCEDCDDGDPTNEAFAALERHHEFGEAGA